MIYVNPFSEIKGILDQRVDQGVDFSGNGPIKAIGDGTVVLAMTGNQGWPGGGYMAYRLDSGPAQGKVIYVAEEVSPTVHQGQKVRAGETIAHLHGFMETGWADSSGSSPESQTSAAGGISGRNLPPGGTRIGRNFEELLSKLGVGRANNLHLAEGGTMPPGYPDWGHADLGGSPGKGVGAGIGGTHQSTITPLANPISNLPGLGWIGNLITGFTGTATGVADVATAFSGFVTDTSKMIQWLSWIFQPSSWVRITAGLAGMVLFLLGLTALVVAVK